MNVLLINGSPHKKGCTYTALSEVAGQLGLYRVRRLPGNRAVRI